VRRSIASVVVLAILLLGVAPASAASRAPSRQIAPDADVLQRFEGSWNRGMSAYDRFLHAAAPEQHLLAPLPADSGEGRRVVYALEDQMVWLVAEDGTVLANYLVSGRAGVPNPGTYAVFSKSPVTRAFLDPNTIMRWMVRFTKTAKTNIGFHDIPVHGDGTPYQTVDELGTALSGGCVRQELGAAKRMYRFVDVGTTVVVTP
jgi:hypothetical protein